MDTQPEPSMPLYEYACRACSSRFEALRRQEERLSPPACPSCGRHDTSLRLSAPGFVGAASGGPQSSCASDPGSCCGGACLN
jgi:putative FmdB family regulatory protein